MTAGTNTPTLKSIIERIERLADERQQFTDDIKEIYAEAKSNGLDVKALRTVIRMRREDFDKRAAHEALVETYMHALGMLADTPLGAAAVKAATAELPKVSTADAPFHAPERTADMN
jgi:uncharacterized protein (UPF0335 family)